MSNLITQSEAAERLGVAPFTLRKWRCEGKGPPFHKIERAVRYDPSDLDKWVSARRVTSTSEKIAA